MMFNLNDSVKVKLTKHGRALLEGQHNELYALYGPKKPEYSPPKEDGNGWSEWQLWDLMSRFGGSMYNGCSVPFETEIELIVPNYQ